MPKPDPALLDPARYPYTCSVPPRFGDLDINRHVNNVALIEISQDARVRFHDKCGFRRHRDGTAAMVASLAFEFLGEAFYPKPIECHAAAAHLGRTSHRVAQLLTQEGRVVAWTQTVIVTLRNGAPTELPPAFRESLKGWMLRE